MTKYGVIQSTTLDNAHHANQWADYLAQQLQTIAGIKLLFPYQANTIFVPSFPLPDRPFLAHDGRSRQIHLLR